MRSESMTAHASLYFMGRMVSGAIAIATVAVFTRLMSPRDYGLYSLVVATAGFAAVIGFRWIGEGYARQASIAITSGEQGAVRTACAQWFGIMSFFGLMLALITGWALPESGLGSSGTIAAFVLAIALAWFDLNLRAINIAGYPARYGLMIASRALLFFVAGTATIYFGSAPLWVVAAYIASLILASLLSRQSWRNASSRAELRTQRRSIAAIGIPLGVAGGFSAGIEVVDRYAIAIFAGTAEVGLYAAPYDLTQQTVSVLLGIVHLAAYPVVMRAFAADKNSVGPAFERAAQLLLGISLPLLAVVIATSGSLAEVFLGQRFREAAPVIIVLTTVAAVLNGWRAYYFDYAFHVAGKTSVIVASMACALVVAAAGNVLLIPEFGIVGAALAAVLAYAVALAVSVFLGRRFICLPAFLPHAGRPLLLAVALTAVLWPFRKTEPGADILLTQIFFVTLITLLWILAFDYLGLRGEIGRALSRHRNQQR